ncbi:MAG: DUF167 domain-containing protein [Spirochaetaceae bacterium]|jgi:uncharacterized protein (TIGR00251 family)|nr:DUF167 domain-containing protein [Spirochaetaceae bacterium]
MNDFFAIKPEGVYLYCKITPAAAKNQIQDVKDGKLRIKIAAAPENGKANAGLSAFLAKLLRIPKNAVTIKSGEKSRQKTIFIPSSAKFNVSLLQNHASKN